MARLVCYTCYGSLKQDEKEAPSSTKALATSVAANIAVLALLILKG